MNLRFPIFVVLLSLLSGSVRLADAQWLRPRSAGSHWIALNEASIGDLPNQAAVMRLRLAALLEEKNWEEALDVLIELADQFGDFLIETDGNRYLTVSAYCQSLLAGLPAEPLGLYRDRIDAVAEDWYHHLQDVADTAAEDPRLLDQFFCSSYGDDALLLLGDRALERGQPNRARAYWQQIDANLTAAEGISLWHAFHGTEPQAAAKELAAQPTSFKLGDLTYPDTDLDLPAIRGRLVLASILQGDLARARWELALLQQLHPQSRGRLAGREGVYGDILEELLAVEGAVSCQEEEWPTFAGSPERNRVFWRPLDFSAVPKWQIHFAKIMPAVELPIQTEEAVKSPAAPRTTSNRGRGQDDLFFYPLVVRNWALVKNSSQIFAFDVASGKPAFAGSQLGQIYPRGDLAGGEVKRDERNHLAADPLLPPQYSMTFFRGRLFARMGTQLTSRAIGFDSGYAGNRILCINLDREGALEWNFPAEEEEAEFDREKWAFEGPPLADSRGVYVVMRQGAMQAACYVACLDPQTGRLRWRQKICQANTPGRGGRNEITHTLLTLAEQTLYLNTNLGAIASLRTEDGHLRWIYRYQRAPSWNRNDPPSHFGRSLNPCVYARGVVITAPRDSRSLLAVDATNGRLLWKSAPMTSYPLHLLGVANDMLLAG